MFKPPIEVGETINNRQLMDIFHCACEGGIRYSSKTQTIILVINNTKKGIPNVWHGNIIEFAGRPFKQMENFTGANKRLEQFLSTNGAVFLFEVNDPGKYEFRGRVQLMAKIHIAETDGVSYPVFPLLLMTPKLEK